MRKIRKPKLPPLLDRKISKTGQTRGADDDVIYQNRVNRCNTVLIPFHQWKVNHELRDFSKNFEKGFIVLVNPEDYFTNENPEKSLFSLDLELGTNALIFYETRTEWTAFPPLPSWSIANSRTAPLGGEYVARVPATTATENSKKINLGFSSSSPKGAGIRLYEYASSQTIKECRIQLEAIYWHCYDAIEAAIEFGMSREDAEKRKELCIEEANSLGLLDYDKLHEKRILSKDKIKICPLCLKKLSGRGFYNRLAQAEGREVPDLTVTEINLFHIDELKYGQYNHRQYNLGWGHHHCNVVVKDSGIYPTLKWMSEVVNDNINSGYNI